MPASCSPIRSAPRCLQVTLQRRAAAGATQRDPLEQARARHARRATTTWWSIFRRISSSGSPGFAKSLLRDRASEPPRRESTRIEAAQRRDLSEPGQGRLEGRPSPRVRRARSLARSRSASRIWKTARFRPPPPSRSTSPRTTWPKPAQHKAAAWSKILPFVLLIWALDRRVLSGHRPVRRREGARHAGNAAQQPGRTHRDRVGQAAHDHALQHGHGDR